MMNFTPSSRHWFDHAKFIKSRAQVSNIAKVRPDLPILLVAGSEDAMGKNGEAVRALEADYRATGKSDVTCIIYPEMRTSWSTISARSGFRRHAGVAG